MSTDGDAPSITSVSVPIPKGVEVRIDGTHLRVKGPGGQLRREFPRDALSAVVRDGAVVLTLRLPANRKRSKSLLLTWERHLANLVRGVREGFEARLKSVAAHFPMKLSVKDGRLIIENFLGEKHPRSAPILEGVTATVEGEFVVLRGADIEQVGQCSATIERATHIRDYDPRVFQDGIYIVDRAHPKEG